MKSPNGTQVQKTQFITFSLGGEEYAIEILRVQEIRGFSPITPLPDAPRFVRGVINLRGAIVPIVGLRERFGLAKIESDKFTLFVILNVGARVVGIAVDAVNDVVEVADDAIEPPPDLGRRVDGWVIRGLAKANGRLLTLLDVERAVEEPSSAGGASTEAA
jgi:purine-binding chemotaxis protein CheW